MLENLNLEQKEKIKGAIVCSIIGDIYGLKYEGVKPKYINKEKILEKTFFNMYSDDTEHLLIMLKNINNLYNLDEFNNLFMIDLRKWLLTLPYGIGKATLKSVIKSFFTKKSGVVSQGNGALMRLGILGLFLKENEIDEIVKSNCILTHNSSESVITSVVLSKILNFLLNNEFNLNKIIEIMETHKLEEKYLNKVLEKVKIEDLLDCVFNDKKQTFKMFYLKLFFRNVCVFPLIFIEIIKRYFLHLIGIKI